MNEHMGIVGWMELVLYGPDGQVKERREAHNTVTEAGDKLVADAMSDRGETAPTHMAVGTGTGQGSSDNALATENDRNALDSTTQGTSGADNDVIYVASWAAGDATAALTEAGIFNDSSAGDMAFVASFDAINKGAADTLTITWTITFGDS